MKKLLALILTLSLLALTGCAPVTVVVGNCTCPGSNCPTDGGNNTPAEGELNTGYALVATASEDGGKISYDVTLVGVLVDANGVIADCVIDSLPASITMDATGKITGDLSAALVTKNELGDNYMMQSGSWKKQAGALAAYAKGKTVAQLKNGAIDETGKAPAGSDLASSASIYLGGYVSAIEKAASQAAALGAKAGDTLKMAVTGKLTGADFGEKNGNVQLELDFAVVTMNGDVITSCIIDSLQAKVEFDGTGKIVTDLSKAFATKNDLGDNYMMQSGSWKKQAGALAAYATGKTVAQLKNGAIDETGKAPAGSDLASSASIYLGGYVSVIEKACKG